MDLKSRKKKVLSRTSRELSQRKKRRRRRRERKRQWDKHPKKTTGHSKGMTCKWLLETLFSSHPEPGVLPVADCQWRRWFGWTLALVCRDLLLTTCVIPLCLYRTDCPCSRASGPPASLLRVHLRCTTRALRWPHSPGASCSLSSPRALWLLAATG